MRIGQVAEAAAVNVQTLRYYERRGILKAPRRTGSGYRQYDEEAVQLVVFVKRAQELGFTLAEIEELLTLRDGEGTCAEVRAAALAKVTDIDERVRHLKAMRRALKKLIDSCDIEGAPRDCPILGSLDRPRTRGSAR